MKALYLTTLIVDFHLLSLKKWALLLLYFNFIVDVEKDVTVSKRGMDQLF